MGKHLLIIPKLGSIVNIYSTINASSYLMAHFKARFGYLYHRTTMASSDPIAATGWKIPSSTDTDTLRAAWSASYQDGGQYFKHSDPYYWLQASYVGNNQSHFGAQAGGFRANAGYYALFKQSAYIQTTTYNTAPNILCLIFSGTSNWFYLGQNASYTGFSIRLLKESTSLNVGESGSYTGNDGKVYPTICIKSGTGGTGKQEWLMYNLKETKLRSGANIPLATADADWIDRTTPAYCYPNGDEANA